MEPVNAESVSSVLSSSDPLNLGQGNDKKESVVESMPRENRIPVHCEGNVQTNTTALAETRTKRNTKRKTREAVLKKNQLTHKEKDFQKEKLLPAWHEHHPGNDILKNFADFFD